MFPVSSGRRLLMLVLAVLVAAIIVSPAFAQTSTGIAKGKVVDEKGQPVDGAKVTLMKDGVSFTVTTNKKGEFVRVGLVPGVYKVTAEKAKVGADHKNVTVALGGSSDVDLKLMPSNTDASKEQAQKATAVKAAFDEGVAASHNGDFDGAIAKFQEAIKLMPTCSDCYYNIGQAHTQKKDYEKAEAAYKKAIEVKPEYGDAYNGLATVYNAQKKFDEAAAASQKAAELSGGGAAAGGGGGNATALYNAGVISWNANKFEDAKGKFEEALKLDPNHADSHFRLGMCLVNLAKYADALKEFESYVSLAPNGEFAAQAKAMIPALKQQIK